MQRVLCQRCPYIVWQRKGDGAEVGYVAEQARLVWQENICPTVIRANFSYGGALSEFISLFLYMLIFQVTDA